MYAVTYMSGVRGACEVCRRRGCSGTASSRSTPAARSRSTETLYTHTHAIDTGGFTSCVHRAEQLADCGQTWTGYCDIIIVYYATNAAHKIHTITTCKNRNRSIPYIT